MRAGEQDATAIFGVQWPWQPGFPLFPKALLRAGDDSGELFTVANVNDPP